MRLSGLFFFCLLASVAFPDDKKVYLDTVEPEKMLTENLKELPHILFLNVGDALTNEALADAAAHVRTKYLFNIVTNSIPDTLTREVATDPTILKKRFGEKTALVVAFEKKEMKSSFLVIPGYYSALNITGISRDTPSPDLLTKRIRQMALKGLAQACGVGANADEHCVMFYQSFTLKGMDATSATYGPFAYLPVRELLRAIGGNDIFSSPHY